MLQKVKSHHCLHVGTALLCLLISCAAYAKSATPQIASADAERLVEMGLKDKGYDIHSPKFELDKNAELEKDYFPDFYTFDAYYDTPTLFAAIGTYIVNQHTAEVWEIISCEQIKSKSVVHLQTRLRKKYHLAKTLMPTKPPCDQNN
jgi:hypothetical protein